MRGCGIGGHGWALVSGQGVGNVAVSLARPRRRPAWRRCRPVRGRARPRRRSASAAPVLPDSTRIPLQADPLRGRHVGPQVVADHREGRAREPLAEVGGQARRRPGGRPPATACRGSCARTPGRELEPDDERRRRRASRPSASATTGCGAWRAARRRRGSSRKATSMFRYDRSSPASPMTTAATVPGAAASASSAVEHRLAVELAPGIVGREHEQRPAGVPGRGVGGRGRCRR